MTSDNLKFVTNFEKIVINFVVTIIYFSTSDYGWGVKYLNYNLLVNFDCPLEIFQLIFQLKIFFSRLFPNPSMLVLTKDLFLAKDSHNVPENFIISNMLIAFKINLRKLINFHLII